jgi:putative spermidine/putrescine transport system permease protein
MEWSASWRFGVVLALAWTVLLFLFLPIFVAVPFSFSPRRYLALPGDDWSWAPYANLLTSEDWLSSIGQSLIVASATTALALVLGTLCAIGLWRLASRFAEAVRGFVLMPIIVPPIVAGLAFYQLFVDLRLLDTYLGLILAHTMLAVPYVVITVSTSLAHFDLRLEQAARNLGASLPQTLRYVILPSIVPGMLSGAIFAFILSWDEIVVTLFVTSLHVFTLPRRMWDGIREHTDPTIAAVATVLIVLTIVVIAAHMVTRRHRGAEGRPRGRPAAGPRTTA